MYCVDCGTRLEGAFCGHCGRDVGDPAPAPRAVDASTPTGSGLGASETPADRSTGEVEPPEYFFAAPATDGRRCLRCGGWVAGAATCAGCGGQPDVSDDVGRTAVQAGAQHVHALDMAARSSPLRGGDAMLPKGALIVLALIGVVVALNGVAGFVLVVAVALLAVVPASIADGRGGHWLSWYVYGILILPVAVGHALMLPSADERPGAGSGDRQLRALVGAAAALFITFGVGVIVSGLAASSSEADDRSDCYELSSQSNRASAGSERASLLRAAADCLQGR